MYCCQNLLSISHEEIGAYESKNGPMEDCWERQTHERLDGLFKNTPEGLPGCEELQAAFSCVLQWGELQSHSSVSKLFRRFFWPRGSHHCSAECHDLCGLVQTGARLKNQGEHRGPPHGELDDPSPLFSSGDNTSGISKYWVSLFISIQFALAHDTRNTALLISFQFSNKTKPNLFFPTAFIMLHTKRNPKWTILGSLLRFPSKVLLKRPYFPKPRPLRGALKCNYFVSSQYENNQSDIMCCILTLSFARRL